jgi:paraquat-inducible protein A
VRDADFSRDWPDFLQFLSFYIIKKGKVTSRHAPLVACRDCDLLQQEADLTESIRAHCIRCGAELYRRHLDGLERSLAFATAASIAFLVANAFPIVSLQIRSEQTQTTLYGAVHMLVSQNMLFIATLVLVTTMLVPALQIALLGSLLLPLRFGFIPSHAQFSFRLLRVVQPWGMIDVFMLGLLVSVVKLSNLANVVPGVALWSFAALMPLLAAATAVFDPREFWIRMEARR